MAFKSPPYCTQVIVLLPLGGRKEIPSIIGPFAICSGSSALAGSRPYASEGIEVFDENLTSSDGALP
jgi:hypothetical protein